MIKTVDTNDVLRILEDGTWKVIDIRSADDYNGWTLDNENRGGHIPGAKSLPAKWLNYIDWIEVVNKKDIKPSDKLVIYGTNQEDILRAATRFVKAGFNLVYTYSKFLEEWIMNPELPMDYLPRYQNLVPAKWVRSLISGEIPMLYNNSRYIVIHAHYRNREAYLSGHIPGAIDMDTLALEAPETWNRRDSEELKKAFEDHGITADTTVIVYGKHMFPDNDDPFPGSAAGDIGAIRCAFIMLYAGVKDVRVLNGSFQSWMDEGYEISTDDVKKTPVIDFGVKIPANPSFAVDTPEAKGMIASDQSELVCVRSREEFLGKVSGYNYITKKGRIPGAVFADCGSDAYHMENYRNIDHTTREYNEIAHIWKQNGITADKHLAFYCGTGWRGSEAWFNAWLMGWPKVSVYDGGWYEWSNDPDNPYETGIPTKEINKISEYK